jgi:hypothetical protein
MVFNSMHMVFDNFSKGSIPIPTFYLVLHLSMPCVHFKYIREYTHSRLLSSPAPIYALCSFQVHWRV